MIRPRTALSRRTGTRELGGHTPRDLVNCAKRELERRQREYPKAVRGGKMTMQQMGVELAAMRAIVRVLDRMANVARAAESEE